MSPIEPLRPVWKAMTAKQDVPIFDFCNESASSIELLIEPHLELYVIEPEQTVTAYDFAPLDNTSPERHLTIAYREEHVVIYSPGSVSPAMFKGKERLVPDIL